MPLQYYLVPNHLTRDQKPDAYMAISLNPWTYTLDDVYEYITREGSTITKAEALAVYEEINRGIIELAGEGYTVTTPLVNVSSAVGGVFNGDGDSFEPGRHRVRITVNPGKRLRAVAGDIPVEKVSGRERRPRPVHYYDNGSGTRDGVVTPAGGARITGSLLKFDEADENQGVFFVHSGEGSEIRVHTPLLRNKPGELIFLNPDLPAGLWRLEIRSKPQFAPEIRKGLLPAELSVAES